jgi:hypothetical protein
VRRDPQVRQGIGHGREPSLSAPTADEVICTYGRLGNMFGADKFGFQPDIITTNMARAESASGWRGFAPGADQDSAP